MRKTRKSLKGGRFLGEGGYGCAFTEPPLPCLKPGGGVFPRRSSDQISKLMYSSSMQTAIQTNRMFRRIDPTQTYFISAGDQDRCKPALSKPYLQPSDELDKCSLNPAYPLELLFFEMGGKDLSEITLTARDYAPFFKSLLNILKGMKLAHDNQIVHLDIKPQNIVSRRLPNGEFQTRLIDYDLAIDLTTLRGRNDAALNTLSNVYAFWPFETKLIHPRNALNSIPSPHDSSYEQFQKKDTLNRYLSNWYTNVNPKILKGFVVGDGMPFSLAGIGQLNATTYLNQYAPNLNLTDSTYKEYLKTVDIYMLGITLGIMMNRFFHYLLISKDYNNCVFSIFVKVKTGSIEKYVDVQKLVANGFSKEIQDWHVLIESEITDFYAQLVELMTSMNVSRRSTIDEAIEIYTLFLHLFDTYFTEDAIQTYLVPLGTIQVDAQPALPDIPSPTNLAAIQVNTSSAIPKRTYQIPPTNLRKIRTNVFKGGRRKTYKKRGRK